MNKACNKCKVTKPLEMFFKDKATLDGRYSICKVCKSAATYEWRKKNPEAYNGRASEWRKKNPDKQHATEIKRRYNLTIERYNEMLIKQNNKCAICLKEHDPSTKRGRLYVDHIHDESRRVRGLLCGSCNSAIGYLEDNKDRLLRAIEYLK